MPVFQSTPLREGRLIPCPIDRDKAMFQSTPLREGRPSRQNRPVPCTSVSIHAPTRGATERKGNKALAIRFQSTPLREGRPNNWFGLSIPTVSIHAPTRGATSMILGCSNLLSFNPRPYERGDHCDKRDKCGTDVSIHAPTRGATRVSFYCYSSTVVFQSTPLREGRLKHSLSISV